MTFKTRRKRKEEIYGTLVRNSADGIYVISRGGFEYVNPAFERLVGYSAEEICGPGFDLLGLVHPEDRKLVGEGMDARDGIFEFRIVSRDGGTKYVEAGTSALSRNGGRVMGILRETTARRLANRSLQENEEKYRHVVERASDGIAIIQDSLFKFINPRAAEIGGFTLDELIDTPFSRYLATEDIAALESTYQREPDAEGSPVIFEAAVKRKDGTTISVELSAGRISYQGKPASLVILRDVTDRRRTEEELSLTLEKLRKAMGATIQAMSLTIETRDPYTAGHQKRVSDLARAIATEMKLSKEDIDAIRMAASIHDLGKISIPAEILSKPGKINEFEFRLIQNHPQIGYEILRTIEFPWPIAEIVLQHHERINGSGYPNGLRGEEIHIIARILAVADVVEAMVSHRPYRSALTLGEAIHEITKNRGTLYDPDAVDACKLLFIEGRFVFKA
jgi:PAS domain S-box-containing protein/putative nucleotidyltransferase with HDIG domain